MPLDTLYHGIDLFEARVLHSNIAFRILLKRIQVIHVLCRQYVQRIFDVLKMVNASKKAKEVKQ